jgi:predicted transposase YbfD/YdcC
MERLHYLGAIKSNLGKALQYVIEDGVSGEWLALLDWGYGSLKNSARDAWIGWDKELRDARLKYVVTNTRFLILPEGRKHKCLASQVLSLVTKRLSDDWARYHGHHILVAETFVDIQRFAGTCYRAANWIDVGLTQGFARSNKRYIEHGERKRVFVYPLIRNAREILCSTGVPHMMIASRQEKFGIVDVNRLPLVGAGGLLDALSHVRDGRFRRGVRYKLPSILAATVCAVLCGIDSFRGIAEYAANLPLEVRKRFGFRRGKAPDEETVRRTLNMIDATQLDSVMREWISTRCPSLKGKILAIDGKSMRASRTDNGRAPHILSVVLHHDGIALTSLKVDDKTNEIPVAQQVLKELPLTCSIVTLDALHTQKETARIIVQEKHSDYLMTVKDNQQELLEKIQRLPDEAFSPSAHRDHKGSRKSRDSNNSGCSDQQAPLLPFRKTGNQN